MGTRATLLSLAAAAATALAAADGAMAQTNGCGAPLSSMPFDHTAEAPVFTGVDHDNRAFTLTRDPETGAWALWVISEFMEQGDGVAVGIPCPVVAGSESKVITAPAAEVAAAPQADTGTAAAPQALETAAAETFRVTRVDRGKVLDLRSGAGTDFPSLAAMPPDASGIVVGSCKAVDGYRYSWCEATWQGTQGWASACCLESETTGRRLD